MPKVALHFHPHASFCLRSIAEPASILNFKYCDVDLIVFQKANFLEKFDPTAAFLDSLSGLVKSIKRINPPTELSYYNLFDRLSTHNEQLGYAKSYLTLKEYMLLENSCSDSVVRGLCSSVNMEQYYKNYDKEYGRNVRTSRLFYGASLFKYYREALLTERPDYVAISHGNYDYYISLYLAARSLQIPVQLVHGGHNRSYFINNKSVLTDHAPTSEHIALLEGLISGNILESTLTSHTKYVNSLGHREISPKRSANSASSTLIDCINKSNLTSGKHTYIFMMPILSETTHQDIFLTIKYPSKIEWLDRSLQAIKQYDPDATVVFRMHPAIDFYNERDLVCKILFFYCQKYELNYSCLFDLDSLKECLSAKSFDSEIRLMTFGSSISAELNLFGLSIASGNDCLSSLIPGGVFDQDIYFLDDAMTNKMLCKDITHSAKSELKALSVLSDWLSATSKNNSPDRIFRLRVDLHCFFGRTVLNSNHTSDLKDIFLDYKNSVDIKAIELKDCMHFYCQVS